MPEVADPTFYRSPAAAVAAPPEGLAYVAAFDPGDTQRDAMTVVDCDARSTTYGEVVGWTELPTAGNELHHFGWNACSTALCHEGHAHDGSLERRYLIVPGIRSSRTYVLDTKPDPRHPQVVRTIEPGEFADGSDGPGGVALLDHDTFEVTGAWETDRGEQHFAYDVWWHLDDDVAITSEWASPSMIEDGLNPEDLLGRQFGHHLDFRSLFEGRLIQRVDLGDEHQMVLELRSAHHPQKAWGFVGVVISVADLSASVWLWYRDDDSWTAKKVITIPAEPSEASQPPPALQPFGAVPPLVSDIDLSVDDRWLYVWCLGTGELKQYDVSDPHNPREAGSVRLGGIVGRTPHPAAAELRLAGAPQMVEVSRDGRRVYFTDSLYASWDDIFYPDDVGAWMARVDANTETGGMTVDPRFLPHGEDFRGLRQLCCKSRRAISRYETRAKAVLDETEPTGYPAIARLDGASRVGTRQQPRRVRRLCYIYYSVSMERTRGPKSQPFSIRLTEHADLLVRDEVKRSGRSRSVVVEELAEEATKTRLFPGVAFRGIPRRAWVIGTGLDVWEIFELLRSYAGNEEQLRAAHTLLGERHVRLARAYGERFPDEIAAFAEDARRPLDELQRLYPFLQTGQ